MTARSELLTLLGRYLSPILAEGLLSRALREAGAPDQLNEAELAAVLARLDGGIRLFVEPSRQLDLRAELERLCPARGDASGRTVEIRTEENISEARLLARAMCEAGGATSLIRQRAAIIVSELARNIVSYTPGGNVRLTVLERPKRLRIEAQDRGRGIQGLEEILAGRYRSKTGMGKGLGGVKKIADRFDIRTGATGTRVEAEVVL